MSAEDNVNKRRWILTLVLMQILVSAVTAQAEGPFFSKKLYGYAALGASGFFFHEAYQARRDANTAYDRYKGAATGGDAQAFYDESRRFDTRVVVMGALGVGALTWSLQLLRGQEREGLPLPDVNERALKVQGIGVGIAGDLIHKQVQLTLSKDF